MLNQFSFPNQANNMNIMFYKQEIMKLIDEIIEIDLEIYKYQYNQQQMVNQFFMQNQNMMMMQNMPFIQSQFMNPQLILEQKIKLYKEKFEKLTAEKIEKNKMSMNMKQMFPSWNNNNFINPLNNPMNNLMNNPMNNLMNNPMNNPMNNYMFNLFMQMNMMNNNNIPGMQQMNPSIIQKDQNVEYLTVRVMMEDGKGILVQCKSNDKLEIPKKNFLTKIQSSDDFDFFIITETKAKKNLTVKENGIIGDNCYISARKKLKNSNENNVIEQNIQYNEEYIDKNDSNNNLEINPINLGPKMNLTFAHTSGLKINLYIDQNKTFKEAVIMFCNKVGIPFSSLYQKKIFFLYNANKLNIEDNRKLAQIFLNFSIISVVDVFNIIGA